MCFIYKFRVYCIHNIVAVVYTVQYTFPPWTHDSHSLCSIYAECLCLIYYQTANLCWYAENKTHTRTHLYFISYRAHVEFSVLKRFHRNFALNVNPQRLTEKLMGYSDHLAAKLFENWCAAWRVLRWWELDNKWNGIGIGIAHWVNCLRFFI